MATVKLHSTFTRSVLAEMLVENTGAHLLDSGGAYGRHHERNRGKTEADFEASPSVLFDKYGVSLNVYHYLARRLAYAPHLQGEFDDFVASSPDDEGWLSLAESFAQSKDRDARTWNTYNGECLLSQTVQGVSFQDNGETYALIQIHGGCDVRGGYTKPRIFRVVVDMAEEFPYDHASYFAECSANNDHDLYHDCGHFMNASGVSADDGELMKWSDEHDEYRCGVCGAPIIFHAPEPY